MWPTILLGTFLLVVILPVSAIGIKLAKSGTASSSGPSTSVTATSPSAGARPAAGTARTSTSVGGVIATIAIVGLVTLVVFWVGSGVAGMMAKSNVATEPQWGKIETLTLTDRPTIVPWQEGATNYRVLLAPGETPGHYFWLKSGNDKEHLLSGEKNKEGPEIYIGKPCFLRSTDDKPMKVTWQWKK